MEFKTIAELLYPYWLLGIAIIFAVICAGQKNLLRIEKKPVKKWISFLAFITVFWEDVAHGLPLVILKKLIGTKWWTNFIHLPLLAVVMIEFGLGHAYQ